MSDLSISAIICTHNRDRYLAAAIDSLLHQDIPNFEVLVIDNASTDTTRQIVEARLGDPRLKYVYESTLGLSTARNRGFQESTGEIIAYLDDDAVAEPYWLGELLKAYDVNDRLAVAGGRVTLLWPEGTTEPPAWISEDMMSCLGAYDLGTEVVNIQEPGLTPRGLNYSLRRSFLKEIGGFDSQLGRVGKKLLSNEELVMTELALGKGWQVQYLPQALVAHNVAEERMQRDWFLKRSWWQGVSEFYRDRVAGRPWRKQFAAAGERFARGVYKAVKFIFRPDACFDNLTYAYGQIGYMSTAVHDLWKKEEAQAKEA